VAGVGANLKQTLDDLQRSKDSYGVTVCRHLFAPPFVAARVARLSPYEPAARRLAYVQMYAKPRTVVCKPSVISVSTLT
jgi:hypothetical protein